MKIGDKFPSFDEFLSVFSKYKKNVLNEYWIRDARTIENQKKRNPDTVKNINTDLKYYYVRYACVKGGRSFKSKNENSTSSTMKQDCEATLFLKVSACKQFLNINEINESHNHTSTKSYFTSLTQQRLKLPNNVKVNAVESPRDTNKKILETGCRLTLKDLTDLTSKKDKEKIFEECINMLKDVYQCTDVELLVDENNIFKGLYFQDERMKKYFEAFPEIIFIDGTHCLVDLKAATYLIMVEDGNGLSEIVAVCLLVDENQKSINLFIETFKNRNKNCDKVQVVMSDKDKTERKVFTAQFPHSKLLISLFNVFQNFNREVSVKKMDITYNEVRLSKEYLQKLVYAPSETKYQEYYNEMITNVPDIVKQYYDCNWGCIKEQFVPYLTLQNLGNKTNGLECINSKLKNVINKYSTLEDFLKNFFILVNSSRGEKDTKNFQMLNRALANPENETENLYYMYLTKFAFEKLKHQLKIVKYTKEFRPIRNNIFLVQTSEGLLQVTPTSCECLFRKSLQLPCRHIFKCRQLLSLSLFDTDLCLDRWTRTYCENIFEKCAIIEQQTLQEDESTQNRDNIVKASKKAVQPKCLTNLKKFKLMNDQGKLMAQLSSEVSTPIFFERLNIIKTITKYWSEGKDSILLDILKTNIPELERQTEGNENVMMNDDVLEFSYENERGDELEYFDENESMDIDYEGHFIANPNLENSFIYNDHQKLEEHLIPSVTVDQIETSDEAFTETHLHPVDPKMKNENTPLTNYQNFDAVYIKEEPTEEHPQNGELYENVLDSIKNEQCLTDNDKQSDKQSDNPVIEYNNIRETQNTNLNSFDCVLCNKSYTVKSKLIKHIKRHTAIKEFVCPVCKKLFTQKGHLNCHMKSHAGIKEYQCPTCNKSFTYNSNLKTHMKMHTGAKDYKCTICNKRFTFNSTLYNHMKIHTRAKEY